MIKRLPNNTDSSNRRPEKPSRLMVWGRRLMLLTTLAGGGLLAESCAHVSDKQPTIELPDNDPEQTLLRRIGMAKAGSQPDGSEIRFGTGKDKEEANYKSTVTAISIIKLKNHEPAGK